MRDTDTVGYRRESVSGVGSVGLLEALPIPAFVFSPITDPSGQVVDFHYEFVNEAACRLYGMPRGDIVGRRQLELFPSADPQGVVAFYAAVLASGVPGEFEVAEFDENGVEGDFLLSAVAYAGVVVVTAVDITRRVEVERELARHRREFEDLAESASDAVFRLGLDTSIEWVSRSIEVSLGWTPSELLGRPGISLIHPEDLADVDEALAAVGAGGIGECRARVARSDGGWRWMEFRMGPVTTDSGDVSGIIGGTRDIHAEVEARLALEASERQYQRLAQNASDVVIASAHDGTYTWVSHSVHQVLGWLPEELLGRRATEFIHPDDLADLVQMVEQDHRIPSAGEFRYRCADGRYRWFAWTNRATDDVGDGQSGYVGSMVDISERRHAEDALRHAATHDPLTDLANRTALIERTDEALRADAAAGRARTALLLLDLDHFKYVNDAFSHEFGDRVLIAAAERVRSVADQADVVARHGGDEMAVLLVDVERPDDAIETARRLVRAFREPLHVDGREAFTTVSIGVAMADVTQAGETGLALLRDADTATYAAKEQGRDRAVWFTPDMRAEVQARIHTEEMLRHAWADQHLEVWYQPEVSLVDESLKAVEALLRWRQPNGSVRSAGEFIAIAEGSGLILDIGIWVVRTALAQAHAWSREWGDVAPTVRINLSPMQLAEPGFLSDIDDLLIDHAVVPGKVCVEITEAVMLNDSTTTQTNLAGLADRGFALAIDDFGTGYASLTYLHRYPVRVLKIDRSFIRAITHDERDLRLVSGLIAFADRLGLSVVAEGVETVEQANALRELGCPSAQGFLYSPAVPPDRIVIGPIAH